MKKNNKWSILILFTLMLSLFIGFTFIVNPTISSESRLNQECGDILVIGENITLPFPLTAVFAVYNQTEFNRTDDWRAQSNAQNYYDSGSDYYNLTAGRSVITGINLPDDTWVVVVVANDKSSDNIALDSTCGGGGPDGFPFSSITYNLNEGDVFNYSISLKFDGVPGNDPMPFFGINNSDGSEFTLKNDDTLTMTVIDVPDIDLSGGPNGMTLGKVNQEENGGPNFGVNVTMASGGFASEVINGMIFIFPTEFIDYVVDNGTDFLNQGDRGGPEFWQTVHQVTDTHVYLGSNDLSFNITYDRSTGVFTHLGFGGKPDPNSPNIELSLNLITDGGDDPSQGGFPFSSITYNVNEGDVFNYSISLKFDGVPGDTPMPFFGINNSDGNEFTVKNDDILTMTLINVPDIDLSGGPSGMTLGKVSQEENDGPNFEVNVTISSGGFTSEIFGGMAFIFPIEFLNYIIENGTDLFNQGDGDGGGPEFWQKLHQVTATHVYLGSNDLSFNITYDRSTGVFTHMSFSGKPDPNSPNIELSLELIDNEDHSSSTSTNESSGTISDTKDVTTTPSFEPFFLIFGICGLVIIRRRKT